MSAASGAGRAGVPRRDVVVSASGPVNGALAAPASKSVTNRLLVIAALAEGTSMLGMPLDSDDSAAMRGVVTGLGAKVDDVDGGWRVTGTGGRLSVPDAPLDARLSGTTMRFGAALAALAPGEVTLTGQAPLLARPIGPLVAALRALGGRAFDSSGFPPVVAGGSALVGGDVEVDVRLSSQFASAILLVAPYASHDTETTASGGGASDYVALTAASMREWGADVDELGPSTWRVRAGTGYVARDVVVEHDASAAAHLWALAAATGGSVTVVNAGGPTHQPDAALPDVLEQMGCEVSRGSGGVTVRGPRTLRSVRVDLHRMPDQVTTVAALAALANGTTEITGVAVARRHETDRLAALATELRRLGVVVDERPDGLRIEGGTARGPATLATYDDHRLAMAFASIAARIGGVVIGEPWCVTKTYPHFWADAAGLGIAWQEVHG